MSRCITAMALCLSLISCSSLPLNGALLDRALEPREELEPVSCQCNVYCTASLVSTPSIAA